MSQKRKSLSTTVLSVFFLVPPLRDYTLPTTVRPLEIGDQTPRDEIPSYPDSFPKIHYYRDKKLGPMVYFKVRPVPLPKSPRVMTYDLDVDIQSPLVLK